MFRFVGQFIAQALQDERPLDLPVCRPFCKWLLGQPLRVSDVASIDEEFARSLEYLESLAGKAASVRCGA